MEGLIAEGGGTHIRLSTLELAPVLRNGSFALAKTCGCELRSVTHIFLLKNCAAPPRRRSASGLAPLSYRRGSPVLRIASFSFMKRGRVRKCTPATPLQRPSILKNANPAVWRDLRDFLESRSLWHSHEYSTKRIENSKQPGT